MPTRLPGPPKMRFSGVWAHCQPARLWDRPRYAASDFCGDWIASFRDRHTLYVAREFGFPKYVRVDNGTELTSNIMQAWSEEHDVELLFIQPGKPTQNAYIESFNSRVCTEFLDAHWFRSLLEARTAVNEWRHAYHTTHAHSALNYMTPEEFLATYIV